MLRRKYEEHTMKMARTRLRVQRTCARFIPTGIYRTSRGVIDEAASRVRIRATPRRFAGETQRIAERPPRRTTHRRQNFQYAAELRDRELRLTEQLEEQELEWKDEREEEEETTVTREDVAEVISMWTGIPVRKLAVEETERLLHMEDELHKRIMGQDEAIINISKAVRRARAGVKDPRRPMGVFLSWPDGRGQDGALCAPSDFMFGSGGFMCRLDMSEFMSVITVARLIRVAAGEHTASEDGGQLTEAVHRKPYCTILLDRDREGKPGGIQHLLQNSTTAS